jgi:hypothetical protein
LTKTSLLSAAPEVYGIKGVSVPKLEIDYRVDANGDSTSFKLSDQKDK